MVPVTDQRDNGNVHQLAEFSQRTRQDGCRPAKRITCLRIQNKYVAVAHDLAQMTDQRHIIGEFALADAPYVPEKLFPADKSVYGHHVIGAMRKDRPCRYLEIHKRVMIAQHQIRRLQSLSTCADDLCSVNKCVRCAENVCQRP